MACGSCQKPQSLRTERTSSNGTSLSHQRQIQLPTKTRTKQPAKKIVNDINKHRA